MYSQLKNRAKMFFAVHKKQKKNKKNKCISENAWRITIA